MNEIRAIRIFVEVVRNGSFAAAARDLRISTSAVTRYVSELEKWLGLVLIHRSTRRMTLTDAGARYLDESKRMLQVFDDLHRDIRNDATVVQGNVRITAAVVIGKRLLSRALPGFMEKYPQVSLDVQLNDRVVKLIDEGFDIALRIGDTMETDIIATRIGVSHLVVVASPQYLEHHGTPASPSRLMEHECIVETFPVMSQGWPVGGGGASRGNVRVKGRLVVNNGEFACEMALAGLGVAMLPDIFVREEIDTGRLVQLFPDLHTPSVGLHLLSPHRRITSRAVQSLTDHLADFMNADAPGTA